MPQTTAPPRTPLRIALILHFSQSLQIGLNDGNLPQGSRSRHLHVLHNLSPQSSYNFTLRINVSRNRRSNKKIKKRMTKIKWRRTFNQLKFIINALRWRKPGGQSISPTYPPIFHSAYQKLYGNNCTCYTLREDHPVEYLSKATCLSTTPLIHVLGATHHSLATPQPTNSFVSIHFVSLRLCSTSRWCYCHSTVCRTARQKVQKLTVNDIALQIFCNHRVHYMRHRSSPRQFERGHTLLVHPAYYARMISNSACMN